MGLSLAAMDRVLERLAKRGVFRSRDLNQNGVSPGWMDLHFRKFSRYGRRQSRVWVAPGYQPNRYEVAQIRFPRGVFAGPSALWLLGVLEREPDALWLALENKARVPRTLGPGTVILRTRCLEDDVLLMRAPTRPTALRVHDAKRALADLARRELRAS